MSKMDTVIRYGLKRQKYVEILIKLYFFVYFYNKKKINLKKYLYEIVCNTCKK